MTRAELTVENDSLREQLRQVLARLDQALAANAALALQVAKLNERIGELLPVAQRKQRKAAPEKPPAVPPALAEDAKKAFDARPQPPEKPIEKASEKARTLPTGRKAVPEHLEAEEHELKPDACAHCGGKSLDLADEVLEEKHHVVKEHQRRRVVRRKTCRCRACGKRTTLAPCRRLTNVRR